VSNNSEEYSQEIAPSRERMLLGGAIFVLGQLSPLLIPLIISLELPATWTVAVSGLLLLGTPEFCLIAAVAIMGKAGFDYFKRLLCDFLKKHGPPDQVGLTRYCVGLVMFLLPLLLGFCAPYIGQQVPVYQSHPVTIGVIGDLMLVCSVFVLGGDFWDKLRALFVHKAKVQFPTFSRP
jgi:hypothetical protein